MGFLFGGKRRLVLLEVEVTSVYSCWISGRCWLSICYVKVPSSSSLYIISRRYPALGREVATTR